MTWLECIMEAFNNLGGVASYSQLYEEIESLNRKVLSKSWKAVVRATIEKNSSDSTVFEGKNDIFYSVDGLGKGIWGIRDTHNLKNETANDLGDIVKEDDETYRVSIEVKRIVRDSKLIKELKALHDNTCQICNVKLKFDEHRYYSEGHHIKPLGHPHNGPDIKENIIILCPNCHAMCDYGAIRLELEKINKKNVHTISKKYVDYHNNRLCKLKMKN